MSSRLMGAWSKVDAEGKDMWVRHGSAYKQPDGTITVFLESLPLDGKFILKDLEPQEEDDG